MRAAGLLFFAFALASCAELRWHKAGADDAALLQDLSACRKLAEDKIARLWGVVPPAAGNDPRFSPPSSPSQAELRLQVGQAVGACMRARGYTLVAGPEAARK